MPAARVVNTKSKEGRYRNRSIHFIICQKVVRFLVKLLLKFGFNKCFEMSLIWSISFFNSKCKDEKINVCILLIYVQPLNHYKMLDSTSTSIIVSKELRNNTGMSFGFAQSTCSIFSSVCGLNRSLLLLLILYQAVYFKISLLPIG